MPRNWNGSVGSRQRLMVKFETLYWRGYFPADAQRAADEFVDSHRSFQCQPSAIGIESFAVLRRTRHAAK
jgi:hypothetical protein